MFRWRHTAMWGEGTSTRLVGSLPLVEYVTHCGDETCGMLMHMQAAHRDDLDLAVALAR